MIQRLHEGLGMAEEAHKGQFSLTWKALRSVPFYLSTMLIILSLTSRLLLLRFLQSITTGLVGKKGAFFEPSFFFHFSRGVCHRIDIGELSHPAMHKRLFHAGNAVDDENKS